MGSCGKFDNEGQSLTYFRRLNQLLLALAALFPLLLFLSNWRHVSPTAAAIPSRSVATEAAQPVLAGLPVKSGRLFPYSVIPGGAHSLRELKNALAHDPVAAAHYAGFHVTRTRVIRVPRNELMYVSYRIGNQIYWTSKRLVIPGGETILSDGEHEARTRCGNRLSETPRLPVSAKEPSRAALNGPPLPVVADPADPRELLPEVALLRPVDLPGLAAVDPPGGPGGPTFIIPPVVPILAGTPGDPLQNPSTPPTPPVAPTPEPSSLLLFSAGLFGVFALRRKFHS